MFAKRSLLHTLQLVATISKTHTSMRRRCHQKKKTLERFIVLFTNTRYILLAWDA